MTHKRVFQHRRKVLFGLLGEAPALARARRAELAHGARPRQNGWESLRGQNLDQETLLRRRFDGTSRRVSKVYGYVTGVFIQFYCYRCFAMTCTLFFPVEVVAHLQTVAQ